MPPDVSAHDSTQMLFYFVCALGSFIAGLLAWTAKFVLIPLRDAGMEYLKNQTAFSAEVKAVLVEFGPSRQRLHDELVGRFDRVDEALAKVLAEINVPPN